MAFCIPKESAVKLAKELKSLGEDPFGALEKMTSKERRNTFSKIVSESDAKSINSKLEEAFLQDDKGAVLKWAKKNLKPDEQKEIVENVSDFEKAIKDGSVYEDLINKKLGTELSTAEVKKFSKLGKDVFEAGEKLEKAGGEVGNVLDDSTLKLQEDYFKKLDKLSRYTEEISPRSGTWKTFIQYTAKTAMLGAVNSFALNIQGNSVTALTEAATRRMLHGNLGTRLSKEKAQYISRATKIFNDSRFDIARSTGLKSEDSVIGAGKFAGEEIATPENALARKYGEFIFDKALGVPDVFFGALQFADNAGVMAQKLAKGDIKIEKAIFIDAARLDPKTEVGKLVREVSVHNARVGTFTNSGALAEASVSLKRTLNKAGQLGEIVMPFVKTPTNVISMAGDFAGVGLTRPAVRFAKKIVDGVEMTDKEIADNWTAIIRAGMGFTFITAFASMVDIDDYIGAYDPSETQQRNIKGATPDSVKIGGNHVSLDYFGPFRSILKFQLELKANQSIADAFYNTARSEFRNLPVVSGVEDVVDVISKRDVDQVTKKIDEKLVKFFSSRLVPAQVGQLAKASDDVKRDITTRKYGPFDALIAKIPGARETLPKKVTVLGEDQKLPSALKTLTFGARVSEASETVIADEYRRLEDSGNTPKFKDITFTRSEKVKRIEEKIGKEEMIIEKESLGKNISKDLNVLIESDEYGKLEDEDKKEVVEKTADNRYNEFLEKHGEGTGKDIPKIEDVIEEDRIKREYGVTGQVDLKKWEVAETMPEFHGTESMQERQLGKMLGLKDEDGKDKKASISQLYSHYEKVAIISGENVEMIAKKPKGWKARDEVIVIENNILEQIIQDESFKSLSQGMKEEKMDEFFNEGILGEDDYTDWFVLSGQIGERNYKIWLRSQ